MAAKIARNVRFRPDQIKALKRLETDELDFSALTRIAVDQFLAKRRRLRVSEEEEAGYRITDAVGEEVEIKEKPPPDPKIGFRKKREQYLNSPHASVK